MKNGLLIGGAFIFGAAVGVLATYKTLKIKYERIAQEEIDSVKEVFSKKTKQNNTKDDPSDDKIVKEVEKLATKLGYSQKKEVKAPYVIKPDEYGEDEDYELISLTYFSDGVLANEVNEIIEDIPGTVGRNSLNHFGEYEDDSVFVRDEERQIDYEILWDNRTYSEAIQTDPRYGEL